MFDDTGLCDFSLSGAWAIAVLRLRRTALGTNTKGEQVLCIMDDSFFSAFLHEVALDSYALVNATHVTEM